MITKEIIYEYIIEMKIIDRLLLYIGRCNRCKFFSVDYYNHSLDVCNNCHKMFVRNKYKIGPMGVKDG